MLNKLLLQSVITMMAAGWLPAPAGADSTGRQGSRPAAAGSEEETGDTTLLGALQGGSTAVRFRYRYEFVAEEAFALDAHASTLRTTLRYDTLAYHGLGAGVEVENVRPIGGELYDNRGAGHRHNGRFGRPVVADPGLTEINQAVLRFTARPGTVATFGRQEILFDDQRFVGPVGWRQNQQSFDAARLDTDLLPKGRLTYALLHNVHRVTGAVDPLTGHLLHAAFGARGAGALTLYAHALDYERHRHRSATTFGVEITGKRSLNADTSVSYEVEAARQHGTFGNPTRLEAGYLHLAGGGRHRGVAVRAGWERLGGSAARGQFNTPLATLHPFNGWADKFLVTPANGLDDLYVRMLGDAGPVGWTVAYHDFSAATRDSRHGRELDLELVYRTAWDQQVAVTVARYDADGHSTDTTKVMIWTTFGF